MSPGDRPPSPATSPATSPLFVSKYQPLIWNDEDPTSSIELKRDLRWKLLRKLHSILSTKSYRLKDLESTLWKISNGPVKSETFVCIIMSRFRFEKRAGLDRLLFRLYRSFEGGEDECADWRDVVASLLILREYKQVQRNAVHVLLAVLDVYIDARQSVDIHALERALRLASVTDGEVSSVSSVLHAALSDTAPSFGYKARPWHVPKRLFLDMIQGHRVLVSVFQKQAWSRLTEDMRLEVLTKNEDKSAFGFEAKNEKYMIRRAIVLYHYMLCRRMYAAWKLYLSWVLRVRKHREREMEKRMLRFIRWWHSQLRSMKSSRLKRGAADALGEKAVKLRIIRRMQQWHVRKQMIHRVSLPYAQDNRWFMEGLRYLREVWEGYKIRVFFREWFEHAWMESASEEARMHHQNQMLRRHFSAAKSYLMGALKKRKKEEQENRSRHENQDMLMNAMEEIRLELERQEEEERRQEEERKRKEQEERLREKAWDLQRKKAEKQADNRLKLQLQADARAARIQAVKQKLRREHDAIFQRRLQEEPANAREMVESWFDFEHKPTMAGLDIVPREFRLLRQKFFAPPRVGEEGKESLLTSPVNIIFVYIDVVLNSQDVSLADLFRAYDKSGSGYMSHDDFIRFMKSLPLPLHREQIKDIIQKVDASGDGFVDLEELENAQRKALEELGEPSSPWKMYVDPAQSVLCYHNILTDEKVYDYKMTDNKLYEILHCNLLASEIAKVKAKIMEEEPVAWLEVVQDYSIRVIQRAWHMHQAWAEVKQQSWRAGIRMRHELERDKERAGDIIRRFVHMSLAKRELRYLARICFEKNIDPSSGLPYYINYNNGQSQWTRPCLLTRPDEDVTLPWCTQYKPDDPSGQAYFYRPDTATWSEEKPDGYLLCNVCSYNLAVRQCSGPGCDGYRYCFGCFHRYHVSWSMRMSRGDHEGVLMEPVSCTKCTERLASRNCGECQAIMCKACFIRIHRNPLVAHHTWEVVA